VAFISGLGTFGLHKSLITEKGCAGRLDSVITDYEFAPTKRDYVGVYDRCIECYACVGRCPVAAITKTGKDIRACARYVLARKNDPEQAVCGKCLTQVACEDCAPARRS
jgi:epoxyqueuosine reductase QueG